MDNVTEEKLSGRAKAAHTITIFPAESVAFSSDIAPSRVFIKGVIFVFDGSNGLCGKLQKKPDKIVSSSTTKMDFLRLIANIRDLLYTFGALMIDIQYRENKWILVQKLNL
jgi:hypothetical protein